MRCYSKSLISFKFWFSVWEISLGENEVKYIYNLIFSEPIICYLKLHLICFPHLSYIILLLLTFIYCNRKKCSNAQTDILKWFILVRSKTWVKYSNTFWFSNSFPYNITCSINRNLLAYLRIKTYWYILSSNSNFDSFVNVSYFFNRQP